MNDRIIAHGDTVSLREELTKVAFLTD